MARARKNKPFSDGSFNWVVEVLSSDGRSWVTVRDDYLEIQEAEAASAAEELNVALQAIYKKTP